MSFHPPTTICSGSMEDNEDKERVLLTNPETRRGSVHSTDQSEKGRPEWLFPRCPADLEYMLGCAVVITKHDEENKLPTDLQILRADIYGDGDPYRFVVRIHTGNTSRLKRTLERTYFHKACPHGIIVVVPCNDMVAHILEQHEMSEEEKTRMVRVPLDTVLVRLLEEEKESVDRAIQAMMQNPNHEHHHDHHHHHH